MNLYRSSEKLALWFQKRFYESMEKNDTHYLAILDPLVRIYVGEHKALQHT